QGIRNVPVSNAAPADGNVLTFSQARNQWEPVAPVVPPVPPLAGDVAGAIGANSVGAIRGTAVDRPPTAVNQALTSVAAAGGFHWRPVALPAAPTLNFVARPAAAGPYSIVAAGVLSLSAAPRAPIYNGLRLVRPPDPTGALIIGFTGYKVPDGSFMYIVK